MVEMRDGYTLEFLFPETCRSQLSTQEAKVAGGDV